MNLHLYSKPIALAPAVTYDYLDNLGLSVEQAAEVLRLTFLTAKVLEQWMEIHVPEKELRNELKSLIPIDDNGLIERPNVIQH